MNVLVAAASKHGSTGEIARAITRTLEQDGLHAEVKEMASVGSLADYDAVVAGSAVYAGRWMKEAKEFVRDHSAELAARRVWLFSSGPVGDPPFPVEEVPDAEKMVAMTHAVEHHTFAGRLSREGLSVAERAIVRAVHAQEGDFRDWAEVEAWAHEIAEALSQAA